MSPALPEHAVNEPPRAVRIMLPDGSERTFARGVTGAELAAAIGPGLAKAAAVMAVDGELWDLGRELPDGPRCASSATRTRRRCRSSATTAPT